MGKSPYRVPDCGYSDDPYGMPLPFTGTRFYLYVHEHREGEEDGWKYQLGLIDRGFCDSDGEPVVSHPHGNSWEEAYECAGEFIAIALRSKKCVF